MPFPELTRYTLVMREVITLGCVEVRDGSALSLVFDFTFPKPCRYSSELSLTAYCPFSRDVFPVVSRCQVFLTLYLPS